MQVDQRFVQNIQNENAFLRNQISKLNGALMVLDQKYQKSLKQMSSIIHANQNLKKQLDMVKGGIKDQIENSIKEVRSSYEKRIQQLMRQKDDINVLNENLLREKEQIQRDYAIIQQGKWQLQDLKKQVISLKKQNQKLLLQTHPLTQNQENPQLKQKSIQQKFSQKIQELNSKIAELTISNNQAKKFNELAQQQKEKILRENQQLQKKISQLSSSLQEATSKNRQEKVEGDLYQREAKRYQLEALELRKQNADLINEAQRLRLQKLEMTSQINKNQAEIHLLSTLRSLHSQLQPMRFEVQQLKRDKYFERQNNNKEKTQLQTKYLSAQHELQSLKQYIKDLQKKNKDLGQQIRQSKWQKNKMQQIQQQKRILQGRVIVYQAMELVTRNRDKPHHVERIQQFQRRIQLLLQEQNLQYLVNNANVHQLIAMKAYVIQLDNKLQVVAQQNQHLLKKYTQYKERYQQMVTENKQIISKHYAMTSAYKGKIAGYEKLVLKLTQQLDRYIKDSQNSSIQSHYKSVITLYESKILSIHNEINAKKQENRDILKRYENLQMEMKGKVALIRQLELQISNLKAKVKQVSTKLTAKTLEQETRHTSPINNIPEDHYKNTIIQKTKQILQLQQTLNKLKIKLDKLQFQHDRDTDSLKHKINRLQIQNQHLRLQLSQNHKEIPTEKHSNQIGELVSKMTNLEKNLAALSRSQVSSQNPQALSRQIINIQFEKRLQISRTENQYLSKQLERLRAEHKRLLSGQSINFAKGQMNYQQYIQKMRDDAQRTALGLQSRILQLQAELKIKCKQLQIKQRSSIGQSQISIQQPITQTNLHQENQNLRNQLSRIKSNSRIMNTQSEDLMRKIRQMEAYIRQLKQQFINVGAKTSEYQRQIGLKDHTIYQLRFKITTLQQQHQFQLQNLKKSTNNANDRHLIQRERKINDVQSELDRLRRQLQLKTRDLQRLELDLNRRQSQFEIIDRDTRDKLRRLQQRQRFLSEQQNRLMLISQQLQRRQRNIPTMPNINVHLEEQLRSQIEDLQRKIKRLNNELEQKIKIIQMLQQKQIKFIRQKSGLLQELQYIKPSYEELERNYQFNLKQIGIYKQQGARIEDQLQSLWRDHDALKQLLRNKQRELGDASLQIEEIRSKYQIQIRQLNQKINELQFNTHTTHIDITPPIIKQPPSQIIPQHDNSSKYKAEIKRLQKQLQELRNQYQNLKQQMRNRQRAYNDLKYQKQQLERKYQMQIRQINQKIKLLEISRNDFNTSPVNISPERPSNQFNDRRLEVYKQQNIKLEGQLQKLWKEYDNLKMHFRNKQRQVNQLIFDKEQIQRKLELQKKQSHQRIRDLQNSQISLSQSQRSPEKPLDYSQIDRIQRQFQQKLRQIEERNKQKVKQIYKQNQQNTRELQQTISDLTSDLKRIKMQSGSPIGKNQLDAHTSTIHSLQSHLSSLEQEVKRKEAIISQLEQDLTYYKDELMRRQQQLQKLYESTYMGSSQVGEGASQLLNAQKIRLQNQIISLQNVIQRQMQTYNHDQCIKKQHYLRLQIERLNGILQSRSLSKSDSNHPISDNSYLIQLQQNNKKLEQDLTILRQRLIQDFDKNRSVQQYLAILVVTFAQVDALRQRVYQLQQNFKQEHERQVNVMKQLDSLKQHQLDIQKILQILKQLQICHRAFHQQQERSKSTFIKKINTEILVVPPGSQNISILDQINRNIQRSQQQNTRERSLQYSTSIPTQFVGSVFHTDPNINVNIPPQNLGSLNFNNVSQGSFGLNRPYYPPTLQQSPINTGFNANVQGSPQKNTGFVSSSIGTNLANSLSGGGFIGNSIGPSLNHPYIPNTVPNMPMLGVGNLGTTLVTGVSVGSSYSSGGGSGLNPSQNTFRYGLFDKTKVQSIGSSSQFATSQYQNQLANSSRPGSFSILPQPVQTSSNPSFLPQAAYQPQISHSSVRLPSQTNIQPQSPGLSLPYSGENYQTPYMMSSTQLLR